MVPYTFHGSLWLSNGTLLDLNNKTVVLIPYFGSTSVPWGYNGTISSVNLTIATGVSLTFPDGTHAGYNMPTVTADYYSAYGQAVVLSYRYPSYSANPWFGQHTGPQAGVYLTTTDTGTGITESLTLYVSAS